MDSLQHTAKASTADWLKNHITQRTVVDDHFHGLNLSQMLQ